MPQLGWAEVGKKKNGEPRLKRVTYCSREASCMYWNASTDDVRQHEKTEHPMPQDNEPPFDLSTINPQLRRK